MRKIKKWQVSVLSDYKSRKIRNDDFRTADTDAWIELELFEDWLVPSEATISLENLTDGSIVSLPMELDENTFKWHMEKEIIAHVGVWEFSIIFNKDGEDYVGPKIGFKVEGYPLDGKEPALEIIDDWKVLRRQIRAFAEAEALREENELERLHNEGLRVEAEVLREENYAESVEIKELMDQQVKDVSKAEDTRKENETVRVTNENNRVESFERIETDSTTLIEEMAGYKDELDKKVEKEEGKGLSTNDYTDLDKQEVAKVKDKAGKEDLHSHSNKATLDKFSESGGKPLFDGNVLGGKDGKSEYVHIRYSSSSVGRPMSETPSSTRKYIGFSVTNSKSAPIEPNDYRWSKYVGEDGKDSDITQEQLEKKQDKLTAGEGIDITGDVISTAGGSTDLQPITKHLERISYLVSNPLLYNLYHAGYMNTDGKVVEASDQPLDSGHKLEVLKTGVDTPKLIYDTNGVFRTYGPVENNKTISGFLVKDELYRYPMLKLDIKNNKPTHWRRMIYLKFINEDNWLGFHQSDAGYGFYFYSMIDGVKTTLASYSGWDYPAGLSQGNVQKFEIKIQRVHVNTSPSSAYFVLRLYDEYLIKYAIPEDVWSVFDKPTKLGFGFRASTDIYKIEAGETF